MHDISKLGPPKYSGKDHIHPFKSARKVLQHFKDIGTIVLDTPKKQEAFEKANQLLIESV